MKNLGKHPSHRQQRVGEELRKFISTLLIQDDLNISSLKNSFISIVEVDVSPDLKNAKIYIIVYDSLTCSHCASFHKEIYPLLKKDYLDKGLAKIEFRHFPLDIAAFNAS